jgi:hypothetical protein
MYGRMRWIYVSIKRNPNKLAYMDQALTPVSDDDTETLEMFNNDSAKAFVLQTRRLDRIAHGEQAPSLTPTAEDEVSSVAPAQAVDAPDIKRAVTR